MPSERNIGFRQYLRAGGLSKLFGSVFGVCAIIACGQILSSIGEHFPPGLVLTPVVQDPFTVLAYAISAASYTDLDFIKFRLSEAGIPSAWNKLDRFFRQEEIVKAYSVSFGTDIFVRLWNFRFLFIRKRKSNPIYLETWKA